MLEQVTLEATWANACTQTGITKQPRSHRRVTTQAGVGGPGQPAEGSDVNDIDASQWKSSKIDLFKVLDIEKKNLNFVETVKAVKAIQPNVKFCKLYSWYFNTFDEVA